MKKIFDVKNKGRKYWKEMHSRGINAQNERKKLEFYEWVRELHEAFMCADCNDHFGEYLVAYPPEKEPRIFDQDGNELTCFKWSWAFHKAVSDRIGKESWSFEEAYNHYRRYLVVTKECNRIRNVIDVVQKHLSGKIPGRKL